MPRYVYCRNCKKKDVHFEGKYCSIDCADIFERIITEEELKNIHPVIAAVLGYKPKYEKPGEKLN